MLRLEDIIAKVKAYMPVFNIDRLKAAFDYAVLAHHDQYRFSGDPYGNHLLAVAQILLPFRPDENTLIAAFFHDLSETSSYNLQDVTERFGEDVGSLLSGLEKLNKFRLRNGVVEVESFRKMFLTIARDLRVVLVRLADRLHNMQTLQYVQASKQKGIARETMDIYVPLAARLGIYRMKNQLEDLCFQYLYSEQHHDLKDQLDEYVRRQEKGIDHITEKIRRFLKDHHIEADIEGRLKNLYSIYRKLKEKNLTSLHQLFDIFAIRIVLPTRFDSDGKEITDHLYSVLGLIHNQWLPLNNRFKDYVAVPKLNGYKSLHTTVIGLTPKPLNQPTEIQIRSRKMHDEADFGIAAHWVYKEMASGGLKAFKEKADPAENKFALSQDWIEGLARIQRSLASKNDLLQPLKVDFFHDRIFVLTPGGDVKDLPKGATPVDFAYSIHSDIGHRCYGSKVNGAIVPLDYELKNGEVVDILTKTKPDPRPHWLSFVKTAHARNKIRGFLKSYDREASFQTGKKLLNKYLEQLHREPLDDNLTLLKNYNHQKMSLLERNDLVVEVGCGTVPPLTVLKKVFGVHVNFSQLNKKSSLAPQSKQLGVDSKSFTFSKDLSSRIYIAGEQGVPYKLSSCCKPKEGSPVIAYVGRGRAVRVHLQNCKYLKNVDNERTLEATWGPPEFVQKRMPVKIVVKALDRVGLIRDIADTVADFNINIKDFSLKDRFDKVIHREMTLEVENQEQLRALLDHLMEVRNVLEVKKV